MNFRYLLLTLLSGIWVSKTYAQRARVYDNLAVSNVFTSKSAVPSLAYTQTLAIGNAYKYRIVAGARLSQFFVPKTTFDNLSADKAASLTFLKSTSSMSLNIPVGFEIGTHTLAIGINTDILGYSFGQQRDVSYFELNKATSTLQDVQVSTKGINLILGKKGQLNSELYGAVTINDNFTIKAGVSAIRITYNATYAATTDTRANWDSFQQKSINPFIGLRFNFEK